MVSMAIKIMIHIDYIIVAIILMVKIGHKLIMTHYFPVGHTTFRFGLIGNFRDRCKIHVGCDPWPFYLFKSVFKYVLKLNISEIILLPWQPFIWISIVQNSRILKCAKKYYLLYNRVMNKLNDYCMAHQCSMYGIPQSLCENLATLGVLQKKNLVASPPSPLQILKYNLEHK